MRGMILAAGRGQRMGLLTEQTPKPLLNVRGRPLIEYAVDALKEAGIFNIVVNVSWHANQICEALGSGERYGVRFYFSHENEALETGGGIVNALPLLGNGNEPFIVMSADIIVSHPLVAMIARAKSLSHILLVSNPDFHQKGDFSLEGSLVRPAGGSSLTYANVAIFHPDFFRGARSERFPLGPLLHQAVARGEVTGERCEGLWCNVGTPALLEQAERMMAL